MLEKMLGKILRKISLLLTLRPLKVQKERKKAKVKKSEMNVEENQSKWNYDERI